MKTLGYTATLSLILFLGGTGCSNTSSQTQTGHENRSDPTNGYDITTQVVQHPSAYISQMCYTKTKDTDGKAHNPCYACHINNLPPNYVLEDEQLQAAYDFPAPALKNPYANHFRDFSDDVAKISDEEIMNYVERSNYFDAEGEIALAKKLKKLPKSWDLDRDGKWDGYIPDCYYHFDEDGFDRKPDGGYSGWAAFAYMPFLGTFWPTNGSTDDVLIRLPQAFRETQRSGDFNKTVYRTNLAIVQAMIQRKDVPILPTDEAALGVDLDRDGKLSVARSVRYRWAPNEGIEMSYVGKAKLLLKSGKVHIAGGLYPEGTEFLHSVRYIGSQKEGDIHLPPRMKELRYAKKNYWLTYATLQNKGLAALQEQDLDPDKLETFTGSMERGVGTGTGWVYQGFIEDKYGDLRPQSYEETLNCMGCHSGIGVITDSTFAFPRKLNGYRNGWYHWTQKDLKGTPENRYKDGTWELTNYLKLNDYGDEFRENGEVKERFFDANGTLKTDMIEKLHKDVTLLLYPSHQRALLHNKAYRALVQKQRFIEGKAAHIKPLKNIHKAVEEGEKTGNKIYTLPR